MGIPMGPLGPMGIPWNGNKGAMGMGMGMGIS